MQISIAIPEDAKPDENRFRRFIGDQIPRIGELISYDDLDYTLVVTSITHHLSRTDAPVDVAEGITLYCDWHLV